ncbi:hypothetical protein GCM10010521_63030 [Streptomyces rameus]|uniref:Uncharacterized protein n=1 Tax=Streptomyces rameus TaxID=68261 RepID=A0ABN3V353_9ACTN
MRVRAAESTGMGAVLHRAVGNTDRPVQAPHKEKEAQVFRTVTGGAGAHSVWVTSPCRSRYGVTIYDTLVGQEILSATYRKKGLP